MKKVFMSLAIMALTTTAMAAGFNTCVPCSNAVEAVNDDVPIAEQKEISGDVYTIKVPEGWTARSRMVSNTCVMGLNESPYTTASFGAVSYQSLAEYKTSREDDGYTSLENVEVNDHEFIVMENSAIVPLGEAQTVDGEERNKKTIILISSFLFLFFYL